MKLNDDIWILVTWRKLLRESKHMALIMVMINISFWVNSLI